MRKVILDEAVEVHKLVREKDEQGFIAFQPWGIHMKVDTFVETFPEFIVKNRDCEYCPWEISTEYNGVRFFAIIDEGKVAEYGIQVQEQDI